MFIFPVSWSTMFHFTMSASDISFIIWFVSSHSMPSGLGVPIIIELPIICPFGIMCPPGLSAVASLPTKASAAAGAEAEPIMPCICIIWPPMLTVNARRLSGARSKCFRYGSTL